jgi:dTDP-4-dehydrorhamnose 3,5-epimerase
MEFKKTNVDGVYIIKLEPNFDERGYFMRTFDEDLIRRGIDRFAIKQASEAHTKRAGTIRGLHFQKAPKEEAKIVRCVKGKIFDVAVDLRPNSYDYKKWVGVELSEDNHTALYIPKGCAHGLQTLADDVIVEYLIDEEYAPDLSAGIRYDDPEIGVAWPMRSPVLSEKDQSLPVLREINEQKN